jgi:hypothetical protein
VVLETDAGPPSVFRRLGNADRKMRAERVNGRKMGGRK